MAAGSRGPSRSVDRRHAGESRPCVDGHVARAATLKNILAIVAVASCIGSLCRAASPPPVPESLLGCRKLQDDGQRVRCYDAQIAKLTGAAAGSSATQAAPGSSAAQA